MRSNFVPRLGVRGRSLFDVLDQRRPPAAWPASPTCWTLRGGRVRSILVQRHVRSTTRWPRRAAGWSRARTPTCSSSSAFIAAPTSSIRCGGRATRSTCSSWRRPTAGSQLLVFLGDRLRRHVVADGHRWPGPRIGGTATSTGVRRRCRSRSGARARSGGGLRPAVVGARARRDRQLVAGVSAARGCSRSLAAGAGRGPRRHGRRAGGWGARRRAVGDAEAPAAARFGGARGAEHAVAGRASRGSRSPHGALRAAGSAPRMGWSPSHLGRAPRTFPASWPVSPPRYSAPPSPPPRPRAERPRGRSRVARLTALEALTLQGL